MKRWKPKACVSILVMLQDTLPLEVSPRDTRCELSFEILNFIRSSLLLYHMLNSTRVLED